MTPTGGHPSDEPGPEPTEFELAQVSAALRRLPAEVAVPEHISERIAAALAAETAPGGAPVRQTGGTVAWFRRALPRTLAAAAAVGVIGFAGYVVGTSDGGDETTAGSQAESGSQADSGGQAQSEREAPGPVMDGDDAAAGAAEAEPEPQVAAEPGLIEQQVADVWRHRSAVSAGCGQQFADDLGVALIGSAVVGDGVLVVVDTADQTGLEGYLVSSCIASADEAEGEPVVVPTPAQ
ncbi:MAG: hypothetical protein ACRDVZ_10965 [Jiangellaceae bacterium]